MVKHKKYHHHLIIGSELQLTHPAGIMPNSNPYNTSVMEGDTMFIHDEMCSVRQDNPGLSPIEKLKKLAAELGECCMAKDLAALVSQKRDLEMDPLASGFLMENKKTICEKVEFMNENADCDAALGNSNNEEYEKNLMRKLIANLMAYLINEKSIEEIYCIRNPINCIYLIMSAGADKEARKKEMLKVNY